MNRLAPSYDIIQQLRKDIGAMQGHKMGVHSKTLRTGLGVIEKAFPNNVFPTGAVHEFVSPQSEHAAATNGFIAGLLSCLMERTGMCVWIGTSRTIFPATLSLFGIAPERVIFIDLARQKEVLWAIDEALTCTSLAVVVGELRDLSFTESQRLQYTVEKSGVTGFIHRYEPRNENPVACITRWKIKPLPSFLENGMPGVGFPRWNVHLSKVRNGKPGNWNIEWHSGSFHHISPYIGVSELQKRKAV